MRSAMLFGFFAMVFLGFCSLRANARPKKIDYDSAICQKMALVAAGGAGGGAFVGITYGNKGVTASGGDFSIVCPLQHVTDTDDTSTAQVDLKLTANVLLSFSTASVCELDSEGSSFFSMPAFPTPSGTITAHAMVTLPSTASSPPNGLHFLCTTLKQGTQLGSIQVELN